LPDPSIVANNGSFFRNPVVEADVAHPLLLDYPDMPSWEMNNGKFKLSAAWMIESAGFRRDTHDPETGMATWKNQALVLINETAKSTSDLFTFRDKISHAVKEKFHITLVQEPEIIG
jgi:UDP-N-acetylmuramate dehydrogenase